MEYLFNAWDTIAKKIDKNNLFIFLDFDGTLAPIVSTPDKAVLPKASKMLLKRLAEKQEVKLAFISGRQINDIKSKIGIKNAIYSGSHGLQLEGPKIKFEPLFSAGYQMIIDRIKNELRQKTAHIQGVFVEDKGVVLTLHYRLVSRKEIPALKIIFHEAVIQYIERNKINIKSGKMVLEVMPPVKWNKGNVVLWLLARSLFGLQRGAILPIYVGDDVTDEDAFRVLKNKGLTVFVGKYKKSSAQYYLKDHNEVRDFLERILGKYNGRIN